MDALINKSVPTLVAPSLTHISPINSQFCLHTRGRPFLLVHTTYKIGTFQRKPAKSQTAQLWPARLSIRPLHSGLPKARQIGFTVYRPTAINIVCGRLTIFHYSLLRKVNCYCKERIFKSTVMSKTCTSKQKRMRIHT